MVMEKELVAALFGDSNDDNPDNSSGNGNGNKANGQNGGVPVAGRGKQEEEGLMSAEEVLCKVLQGIARPLQVRGRG